MKKSISARHQVPNRLEYLIISAFDLRVTQTDIQSMYIYTLRPLQHTISTSELCFLIPMADIHLQRALCSFCIVCIL
ncbi:hypothetical protein L1887_28946 [Cichorium endivia]|nr:hypothetical protein L1887_28946 [Cichorium endivia]